ncbi:MAG: hypothetical protein ACTHME_03325 [Candidatus Nitrosocosmicus sp.]
MFIPDIGQFATVIHSISTFAVDMTKDTMEPSEDSISGIVLSHAVLIEQLVATITAIGVMGGTVLAGIKRIVTNNAKEMMDQSDKKLEQTKQDTQKAISKNERQIEDVKTNLCFQIQQTSSNISNKLEDHREELNSMKIEQKEDMNDMKNTLEKIDTKLDRNTEYIAVNKTRLDSHENRIDRLEGVVKKPVTKYYPDE